MNVSYSLNFYTFVSEIIMYKEDPVRLLLVALAFLIFFFFLMGVTGDQRIKSLDFQVTCVCINLAKL